MTIVWLVALVFGAAKYDTMGIWGWVLGFAVAFAIFHVRNLYRRKYMRRSR